MTTVADYLGENAAQPDAPAAAPAWPRRAGLDRLTTELIGVLPKADSPGTARPVKRAAPKLPELDERPDESEADEGGALPLGKIAGVLLLLGVGASVLRSRLGVAQQPTNDEEALKTPLSAFQGVSAVEKYKASLNSEDYI